MAPFENAIPVAELAIPQRKGPNDPVRQAPGIQFEKRAFEFHSICPDILHRRRTDASGYQRKVFQAGPIPPDTIIDETSPVLPRPGPDIHVLFVFIHLTDPLNIILKNDSIDIPRQKNIAAATQNYLAASPCPIQ